MENREPIKLKNVRLSFPSIFKRSTFNGQEGKYEATLLLSKQDTATKKQLDAAIKDLLAEAKIKKLPSDKICLKDGDECEKEYDGYADHWSIKCGNNQRPTVIDRNKAPITEEDEKIYAGCYVNALIGFWLQDNNYGKRINANLYGIQFVKDGEPLSAGRVDAMAEFDELGDDLDDDLDDL